MCNYDTVLVAVILMKIWDEFARPFIREYRTENPDPCLVSGYDFPKSKNSDQINNYKSTTKGKEKHNKGKEE